MLGVVILCALFLLSTASCFNLVTGGNVDKEWARNNSKNPRHSNSAKKDTVIGKPIK